MEGIYQNPNVKMTTILKDILTGLSHLHNLKNPIAHRDVKPANALICVRDNHSDPIGVLADLGLSKMLTTSGESFSMSYEVGTLAYMAPELHVTSDEPHRVTLKIDIFSFGCLFCYGITNGQHPFGKNGHVNIIKNKAPNLSLLRQSNTCYRPLIQEMISFNQESRPSAKDAVKRFSALLNPPGKS